MIDAMYWSKKMAEQRQQLNEQTTYAESQSRHRRENRRAMRRMHEAIAVMMERLPEGDMVRRISIESTALDVAKSCYWDGYFSRRIAHAQGLSMPRKCRVKA